MSKLIDSLMVTLPLLKEITQVDCHVCLCDTEYCIGRWDADSFKLPGGCKAGDSILNDSFINEVKRTRKTSVDKLPADVFGTPILNVIMPLYEDGEYVGCIIFCSSREMHAHIIDNSQSLNDNLSDMSSRLEAAGRSIGDISENLRGLKSAADEISEGANRVSELIKTIQSTATKSNMLALNASIEAARAGEHGRGFSVVAGEMGTLAKSSGASAKDISASLGEMFTKIDTLNDNISGAAAAAEAQAEELGRINGRIEEVSSEAAFLLDFAREY